MDDSEVGRLLQEETEAVSEVLKHDDADTEDALLEVVSENKFDLVEEVAETTDDGDLICEGKEEMEGSELAENLAEESKELLMDEHLPEVTSLEPGNTLIEGVEEVDFPLVEEKDVTVIYWDEHETSIDEVVRGGTHIVEDASSLVEISDSVLAESGEQNMAVGVVDPMEAGVLYEETRADVDLSIEETLDPERMEDDVLEQKGKVDFVPLVEESESKIEEAESLTSVESRSLEEVDLPCISMTNGTAEIHADESIGEIEKHEIVTDTIHLQPLSAIGDFESLSREAVSLSDTSALGANETMQNIVAAVFSAGGVVHDMETMGAHDLIKEETMEHEEVSVQKLLDKGKVAIDIHSMIDQMSGIKSTTEPILPIAVDEQIPQSFKGTNGSAKVPLDIVEKTSFLMETVEHVGYKSLKCNEPHDVGDGISVESNDANAHGSAIDRHTVSPAFWLSCCGVFDLLYKK